MMPKVLRDRFQQLLSHAQNPAFRVTAHENIARAKEMIDTLHLTGHLDSAGYEDHHRQVDTARIAIHASELKRVADLIERAQS